MKTGIMKTISWLLVLVSVFALFVSGYGLKDALAEKSSKEAEKAEKVEQLETYKEGLKTLEENRKSYEEGKTKLEEGQKQFDAGKAKLEKGEQEFENGRNLLAVNAQKVVAGREALAAETENYEMAQQLVTKVPAAINPVTIEQLINLVKLYNEADASTKAAMEASEPMLSLNAGIAANPMLAAAGIANCVDLANAYNKAQAGIAQYEATQQMLYEGQAQLNEAQNQLANAAVKLEAGKKELAAAEKELEAGKKQLSEFEEGEKMIKAAEAEMKKNEDIKKNLAENPELTLAEAFQKAIDDATVETTKELTARIVILGAIAVSAILLLIAGIMGLLSKPVGVVAIIGAVIAICALVYSLTGVKGITALQIVSSVLLAVSGIAYFPSCKNAKAMAEAEAEAEQ